ncbi:division/cell wall cluster transcriptional repressor MraZ [Feifania hominis]|uniref:Transcriptional regulator MraZ n=1 Tax=Feifania hominis TaxID=2763660 RepID=A0A926DC98_9FIRM|nr:division/cell wall cluster transcriptional repressor MraZ [Feifania hominis]
MLIGQYKHNVDLKGRLIMPQKFRDDLGETYIVTRGLDSCLFVYPMKEWEVLAERIKALPMAKGRELQRFFFANAEEVVTDAQGRMLIPANLRQYAGLKKEAVVIGSLTRVEIWDRQSWENACENLTGSAVEEAMIELGF